MKKIIDVASDFETTQIKLPKGKICKDKHTYKCNYNCLLKSKLPYNNPEVYSWNICYSIKEDLKIDFSKFNCLVKKDEEVINVSGIYLEDYIELILSLKVDCKIWFCNFKGFDAHYLIPKLEELGFKPVINYDLELYSHLDQDIYNKIKELWEIRYERKKDLILSTKKYKNETSEFIENKIKKEWNKLLFGEIKLMVNKNSQVYSLEIGINDKVNNSKKIVNRKVTFTDTLILFPSSVENMGKTISEYYIKEGMDPKKATDKFHKKILSTNYKRYTLYKNLQELENDGNELEYLRQDCYVVYKWLELMNNYFPRNHWKLTIASTSYNEWIRIFGKSLIDKKLFKGDIKTTTKNKFTFYKYKEKTYKEFKLKKELIKELLPTKWLDNKCFYNKDISTHQFIYNWYSGGISQVNELYRGKFIINGTWFDINSSYPKSMNSDIEVPYGTPFIGDNPDLKFKLYKVYINKTMINEYGMPFVYDCNRVERNYLSKLYKGCEFYLNSIDYEYFKQYYKGEKNCYSVKILYSFKSIPIKYFFKDFIDKWYPLKEHSLNDIIKLIAKFILNALYGKFATKSELESKFWLDSEWFDISEIQKSKYYLPLALSITTISRMMLVDAVGTNYNKVAYMDTDSLLITEYDPKIFNIKIDSSKLGYWDIEAKNCNGFVRRPKQYYFKVDKYKKGKLKEANVNKIAFAGINYDKYLFDDEEIKEYEKNYKIYDSLTFKDFYFGRTINNQTKPTRFLGYGIMIDNIDKKIAPIWDYEPLVEQKIINECDYTKYWNDNYYKLKPYETKFNIKKKKRP